MFLRGKLMQICVEIVIEILGLQVTTQYDISVVLSVRQQQ